MSFIVDISEVLLELGLSDTVTDEERALAQAAIQKASGAVIRYLHYDPEQKTHTEFLPNLNFAQRNRNFVWEVDSNSAFIRRLSEASSDELQVTHVPIRSITTLHIDFDGRAGTQIGAFADPAAVEGQDYWPNFDSFDSNGDSICRDGIIRSEGRWPSRAGTVKIVYVAGYTRTELHGQDTVIDASPIYDSIVDESTRRVLKAFSRRKRAVAGFTGPFKSERLGDYKYETDTKILNSLIGGNWDLLPETREKLAEFCKFDLGVM